MYKKINPYNNREIKRNVSTQKEHFVDIKTTADIDHDANDGLH
jgi:hypothetical protein